MTFQSAPFGDSQAHWDIPLQLRILEELKCNRSDSDTIRLSSISSNCAGGEWLNALPLKSCGLLLSDREIQVNIGLRLGVHIVSPHKCTSCGTLVDSSGTHGLSCRMSKGRHSRHSEANMIIMRALSSAGFPSSLEPVGLSRADGKRPDGVTNVPWSRGMAICWDFSCVDTLAPSRVNKMITRAACQQEERKQLTYKYMSTCHLFTPVVIETLGQWGSTSLRFLKQVGRRMSATTYDKRAGYFLRQRLSIAVARGNAQSIIGTMRDCAPLELPPA